MRNSRNAGPFARRSQTKTSAAVVPSIVVPLVPEKEVNNLLKTPTQLGGLSVSDAQSDVSFQEKTHGVTTGDVGGDGTQSCTMAELVASTPRAQEENVSTASTQSKEDTQNVCSSEVPSAKSVLQLELCIPVSIEKNSLLLEGNTASESLQSTASSNAVVEENTPEFTGSIAEVIVDSHLSDSNLYFNADDFLQNLLQNEHSHDADVIADVMADLHQNVLTNSEATAVPRLSVTNKLPENIDSSKDSTFEKRSNPQTGSHSNASNVITEVMAESQPQILLTCSDNSSLPIFNKQSEKVTDCIDGDSTMTSSNNATGTSSRLVVKRRRKPRNKFPRHVDVASQLEFSAPPQMLDITEIPIASIVEIDLDLCDSEKHEIDHPVLELADDLIRDNVCEVRPEERQVSLKVFRQGFRKKKSGTVKRVVSRRGLGSLKKGGTAQDTLCGGTVVEKTIAQGKEGRKDETVKKKRVGPNLCQARKRTRDRPEQTSDAMPQHDGGIRRSDLDEVENHNNSDNVVEVISESIQVKNGYNQAEKGDRIDGSKISKCRQAAEGDSLTDVVKISENRQAEGDSLNDVAKISEHSQAEGDSLSDVVKISKHSQAEGDSLSDVVKISEHSQDEGDSLNDVVKIPECSQAEDRDSVNDVVDIPDCSQDEEGNSLIDVVKISKNRQAEDEDSLNDVAKIPDCHQAEDEDSLNDVVRIPDSSQDEDEDSLNDVAKIPDCHQAEDEDSLNDVVRIPDSSQDEGDSLNDVVKIPECRQAEDRDSLNDVVTIPEFSQDEDGESRTDIVKISDSSQDEDGDSLTNVVKIPECRQPEHQCSMTSSPTSSNILEDISLSITDDTMGGILNHNSSEPLSTVVECPYTDIITCATSTTSNVTNHTERTTPGNESPEDNSCIAEAGSRSDEAEKQPKPSKPKGIKRKRKNKCKEGSEVAQGGTEGLQESQEVGDSTAVLEEGSDSVTCGKKRKLSKPKPKIPAKRGRKKATSKEPANVMEETATAAESEPGTDGPTPVEVSGKESATFWLLVGVLKCSNHQILPG